MNNPKRQVIRLHLTSNCILFLPVNEDTSVAFKFKNLK